MREKSREKEMRIQEEIEKTLRAFDAEPSLEINPFLITRLEARLGSPERRATPGWVWLHRLRPIAVGLIVLLNILTVAHVLSTRKTAKEKIDLVTSLRQVFETPTNDFFTGN